MQKPFFIAQIKHNLAELSHYSEQKIAINSSYFPTRVGLVSSFIIEIEKTVENLAKQEDVLYLEFYAEKLIKQFEALNKAIEKSQQKTKTAIQFRSSFQFSPNIHHYSPDKRLQEYRKALRALNEKISWLQEQYYREKNEQLRQELQNQITTTELRKKKCLKAIEDSEQELQFK